MKIEEVPKEIKNIVDQIVEITIKRIERDFYLIPKSNKEKDKRYKPILKVLTESKKSVPTNAISLVTGIDEEEVEKKMSELEAMGLIRKTTTKTVRFWKATED